MGLSPRLVVLLAVACGATVANLYYAQPLLDTIARALSVSPGTAGLLVTATQAGYVAGLLFIVPLGDLLQRRRLVSRAAGCSTRSRWPSRAAAPSFGVLAARWRVRRRDERRRADARAVRQRRWRAEEERGRVVGRVMSGLLLGILLARTVAGLVAELGGWRLIYGLAAGAMLVLRSCCGARCRRSSRPSGMPYPRLLALGRHADPRGAGAAPPDGDRLPLDGQLQRALDRRSRSCSPGRSTATARP